MALRSSLLLAAVTAAIAHAQFGRGGGDWMTAGNDAQRSSWVRNDAKISPESLGKPGFDFLWKVGLDPAAQQPFAAPVLLNSYIGYRGFRSLAFAGLTGDKVAGVDIDLGRIEWRQQLPTTGGIYVRRRDRRDNPSHHGRLPCATGGVRWWRQAQRPRALGAGEPYEGAVTLKDVAMNLTPAGPPGGRGAAGRGAAPPGFPHALGAQRDHA